MEIINMEINAIYIATDMLLLLMSHWFDSMTPMAIQTAFNVDNESFSLISLLFWKLVKGSYKLNVKLNNSCIFKRYNFEESIQIQNVPLTKQ